MEKIKCLVVDDEELARGLLTSYIDKVDFLVLEASLENPLEAFAMIKGRKIDLLFLDIQMPEIKGTELAKMIPPDTQIIFTTAYSNLLWKVLNSMRWIIYLSPLLSNVF